MEIQMPMTAQDDIFDELATFAEQTYIFLVLLSRQRKLNPDEVYILDRAVAVACKLHPRVGEAVPAQHGHNPDLGWCS
jgi:hypothetical protein